MSLIYHLSCLVILIFHGFCQSVIDKNLALNKPVYQISTYKSDVAANAVDGSISNGKYSHTNNGEYSAYLQWWMVDLEKEYSISAISVYGRSGQGGRTNVTIYICKRCLTDYQPQAGDKIAFTDPMWEEFTTLKLNVIDQTVHLNPSRKTRIVALARYGFINMAEVKIIQTPSTNQNIAYKKSACQSSTLNDAKGLWSADKAVDGILYDETDSKYAHTAGGENSSSWWMVDLGNLYTVTEIYIHGRIKQTQRSKEVMIYLREKNITTDAKTNMDFGEEEWAKVDTLGSYGYVGVSHLSQPRQARYVAVWRMGLINLKEVEVYQQARVDLTSSGVKRCNGGAAMNDGIGSCSINASPMPYSAESNYLEIRWPTPFLFEFARVSVAADDVDKLKQLQYRYSIKDNPGFDDLKICQLDNHTPVFNTVVCYNGGTPAIRSLRIIKASDGIAIHVTEVNIYATDVPRELASPKTILAGYDKLKIEFHPFRSIPFIYNAYPDTKNKTCKYVVYGDGFNESFKSLGESTQFEAIGLVPDREYKYELTCDIDGIELPGPIQVINARTRTCTAPQFLLESNSVTLERVNSTDLQSWNATIIIGSLAINCVTSKNKIFGISAKGFQTGNEFSNLEALKNYTFTVRVINSADKMREKSVQITTGELAPGPTKKFEVLEDSSADCLYLSWEAPEKPNGKVTHYQYKCSFSRSDNWRSTSSLDTHKVCGLPHGTYIDCRIRACTKPGCGPEETKTARTKCSAPTKPQFSLGDKVDTVNNTRILLTVKLTANSTPNCDKIVDYKATITQPELKQDELPGEWSNQRNLAIETPVVYKGLYPFTNTCVTVVVRNSENMKESKTECNITKSTVPEETVDVRDLGTTFGCIKMKFNLPDRFNAPKYTYKIEVLCTDGHTTKTDYDMEAEVCGLNSSTKYDCRFTVQNSVGDGPTTNRTYYTDVKFNAERNMTKLDVTEVKDHPSVLVKLYPVEVDHKTVSSYLVIAQEQSSTEVRKKRSSAAPCVLSDLDKLKNETATLKSNPRNCYIAASFGPGDIKPDGSEFYLGDGKVYGNYTNQPIRPITLEYSVNYTKVIQSAPPIIGKAVKVQPSTHPTNLGTPPELIAGPVVSAVVVAAIVIVLVIFLRRRKRNTENNKPNEQLELNTTVAVVAESTQRQRALQPPAKKPVVPVRPLSMRGEEYKFYENNNRHLRTDGVDPALLSSFIQNEANKIDEQFEALDNMALPIRSVALLPINNGKSRYKELYPGDESRVKLRRNDRGTDYINASYIAGYKKDTGYIAAMGPTEKTVDDFWLMLWEQNPSGIVMVTKLVELTRMKCYQYWPDNINTPMSFGEIKVTVTNCEEWADYTVRTFQCSKDDETRNIKHFYFLSWPDHGVPKDTGGYLSFYNRIQTSIARLTTPLVVHCSAGVGRTGTFIAMDYLVKQAADENRLQFYECVEKMRMRRPHMIQTVEQYQFLYTAVYEFLSTKDFLYSPDRLASLIGDFGEEEGTSAIHREYKLVQRRVDSIQLQYSKAKLFVNSEKNRFAECLAADGHRVYINESGSSDYINAVFMDTYKEKNHWIATQLPMKRTVEDFWTMVVEQNVKIIVQLENYGKEVPFFPSNGDDYELVFGKFTIARLDDDQTMEVADVIALQVSTKQAKHTVSVVVASKVWEGEPEPNASDLIKIHDQIEKLEQKNGNGITILTCLNGASRCGLMICVYNALDKLKLEQQVDVYCPVLKARLRKPQFIANIAQYALIYQVLKEYVEQFSDYGNFQ